MSNLKKKQMVILGSTGSIGESTLSVLRLHRDRYDVYGLVGGINSQKMVAQCLEFNPKYVVMANEPAATSVRMGLIQHNRSQIDVLSGEEAMCALAAANEVDVVMAAIVGAAGLKPTMAAVQHGKRILLANKEALVMCGQLFIDAVQRHGATLLPVDSEHNAIFQCLPPIAQQAVGTMDLSQAGITQIILTGSGGPFRQTALADLAHVTPEQAVAHPNWSMGRKISVDSATMMNKGLEYIEAKWLFNAKPSEIEILIHPQSMIHSMVRYEDGSVVAELGEANMCTPIAYALSYPERIVSSVPPLDFTKLSGLTFEAPDFERYPCLKLAMLACQAGQAATTILNAANEIAVEAFLKRQIGFRSIATVVEQTLQKMSVEEPSSIDALCEIDAFARKIATTYLVS